MGYLRVTNFWQYQNADVWKKAKTHPPWFKHYVARDRELDDLPLVTRLLFYELLGAATRNSNVLQDDLNWLYAETRIPPEEICEALPLLLKGAWLSETKTTRRSRKLSRNNLEDPRDLEVEVEVEREGFNKTPRSKPRTPEQRIAAMIRNGVIADNVDLTAELRANGVNGETEVRLRTLLSETTP